MNSFTLTSILYETYRRSLSAGTAKEEIHVKTISADQMDFMFRQLH